MRSGARWSHAVRCKMATMRVYLLSLGAGLLVGVVYSLLNVRSPAPPVVALVGLLGILVDEQIIPVASKALYHGGRDAERTGVLGVYR
jgi:XapX domain-containing protein